MHGLSFCLLDVRGLLPGAVRVMKVACGTAASIENSDGERRVSLYQFSRYSLVDGSGPMVKWFRYDHPAMSSWFSIFGYLYQRGAVGSSNGIRFVIHPKESGHNIAHLHAQYQGKEVVIGIPNGEIIAGNLPRSQMKKASEWVRNNQEYLTEQWDTLTGGANLFG